MAKKIDYVNEVIRMVKALGAEADVVSERHKEYFDNGFNSGGAAAITDLDLSNANIELTAAQFSTVVTFIQQFDNLMTNQVVTEADYMATINLVRRV